MRPRSDKLSGFSQEDQAWSLGRSKGENSEFPAFYSFMTHMLLFASHLSLSGAADASSDLKLSLLYFMCCKTLPGRQDRQSDGSMLAQSPGNISLGKRDVNLG